MNVAEPEPLYTEEEAAKLMRMPITWVAKARRDNRIPFCKFGRTIRYTAADIQAAIDRAHVEANPDPIGLRPGSRRYHARKANA